MGTQTYQPYSPMKGKLFGVTHDAETGTEIVRSTKELKVGIGIPQGPALHVWLQRVKDAKPGDPPRWHMEKGFGASAKTAIYKDRKKAEEAFNEHFASAPVCSYPRRLSYLTFSKPEVVDGKLQYKPDFDAIEAHGEKPTKIDILITEDQPLSGGLAMYSRSERLCHGDGINAMRVVALARTEDERAAAEVAAAAGEKYFPILNGCSTYGCPFFGKDCKVAGDFRFQAINSLRIGGCAFLHTTSAKSASSLFSGLMNVYSVFRTLKGIPLKLELQSWRAAPTGQKPSVQYAYKINFDAPTVEYAQQRVLEAASYFGSLTQVAQPATPAPLLIEGPQVEGEIDEESPLDAGAISAEFYPEADGEGEGEPEPTVSTAAVATQITTDNLAEKLKAARKPKPTPVAATAVSTEASVPAEAVQPVSAPAAVVPAAGGDLF